MGIIQKPLFWTQKPQNKYIRRKIDINFLAITFLYVYEKENIPKEIHDNISVDN